MRDYSMRCYLKSRDYLRPFGCKVASFIKQKINVKRRVIIIACKIKTCEISQQLKYYDLKTKEEIAERIKTLSNVKTYAVVIHDKDFKEDGSPKEPHFHAVITFKETTTTKTVANVMKVEEQYVQKIKTTTKSAELYLVHRNNPEKAQYNLDDVLANFDYAEKYDGVEPIQNRKEIAWKIDQGLIKQYNLFEYINIDEYAKNKVFYDRCFQFRQIKIKGVDRAMECIFITGSSGVGKTTLAKNIAAQSGYHSYISAGGKNPLDDYAGQECIILDDLRPSDYKLSDFLKLTDNNTDSLVGCRFYNKAISECKLLIVTSVLSIEEFYQNVVKESDEPQKQLLRRFGTCIKLDREYAYYYSYDETKAEYTFFNRTVNPVSTIFDPKIASATTKKIIDLFGLPTLDDDLDALFQQQKF